MIDSPSWRASKILCFPLLIFTLASSLAQSQQPAPRKRVSFQSSQVLQVSYRLPNFNLDPKKIDHASLIMRESKTGKLVQITLEETEPDSSVFNGSYSVQWSEAADLSPEFYLPPQNLINGKQGLKTVAKMIESGELKRKPFILKRDHDLNSQYIEIFDTPAQAREAYQNMQGDTQTLQIRNQKFPSDAQRELQNLAKNREDELAEIKTQKERAQIASAEASKEAQRLKDFAAKQESEKQQNKMQAKALADAALQLYQEKKYPEAQQKFDAALNLDPEATGYYFQLGVTLYKLDQANRAIVYLERANDPSVNADEKSYFLGLSHFRLREMETAYKFFTQCRNSKNEDIAASSKFYQGVVRFEEKRYPEAKDRFQEVLNTSQDASLSKKADNYIDQILRIQQFEAERAKKWIITLVLAEMYDTNVTLSSTSSQDIGTASNVAGFRSFADSSFKYRPIYEANHEFAVMFEMQTMWSVDRGLTYSQALSNADPTIYDLTAPWTYKGTLLGKGYKLDIIPGLESLWMNVDQDNYKEILNSFLFKILNSIAMTESWFSAYNLEMRVDNAELSTSTGNADSSADQAKLSWGNTVLFDKEKTKIGLSNLAYTYNQAWGVDKTYSRYDLGGSFVGQVAKDYTYTLGVSYFYLYYPSPTNGRADSSWTESAGISRKVLKKLTTGLNLSYNDNESNQGVYTYQKWLVMASLSTDWSF